MKKKISYEEIDMMDLFIGLWNKKKIIIFITIIFLTFGFVYKLYKKEELKFNIKSVIKPITVFEEAKYETYNSYVNSLKPYTLRTIDSRDTYIPDEIDWELMQNIKEYSSFQKSLNNDVFKSNVEFNLKMNDIDKKFLFNLFLDNITQRRTLKDYFEKFKLIDENNSEIDDNFEEQVFSLSESIRKYQIENYPLDEKITLISIELETHDPRLTIDFLEFLEQEINFDIQENISLMFKNYINYVESTTLFQLEDIQSKYEIVQDNFQIELLKNREKILRSDKYIERIKKIFENSPVSESKDFYAARIIYESTDSMHSNISMKKVLIIFGFLGLFIGIITALILNGVESRRLR